MARDINRDQEPMPDPKPTPRPKAPQIPRPTPQPTPQPVPQPSPQPPGRPAPPKIKLPGTDAKLRNQAVAAYQKTGGLLGPLGVPVSPVEITGNTGVWKTSGGRIVTQSDGTTSATAVDFIRVSFVGIKCWKESDSDQGSSSDEPYFICSVVHPGFAGTSSFSFKNIDGGDQSKRVVKLADNLGLMTCYLHVVAMESDFGSEGEARRKVDNTMKQVVAAAQQAATAIDVSQAAKPGTGVSPTTAAIAGLIVGGPLGALLSVGIVKGLDLADDYIDETSEELFGLRHGYGQYPVIGYLDKAPYTHKLYLNGDDEGQYDVFFNVEVGHDERPILSPTTKKEDEVAVM